MLQHRRTSYRALSTRFLLALFTLSAACGGDAASPSSSSAGPITPPAPKQTTRVVAYLRSDTVAYTPSFIPTTTLQGAQATLGGVTGVMPATGSLSLNTSMTVSPNFAPLDVTATNYQPTTYPWFPDDTLKIVALGMYPSVAVVPRAGFVKGIDFMDSGGALSSFYALGKHAQVMDRVKSLDGANLVRTNEAFAITKFNVATNTVAMTPDPWGAYDRAVYTNLVGQAKARGLQFEMGFELTTLPAGAQLSAADATDWAGRFNIPTGNTAFWDAYFAALRQMVLDRAAIARDLGVEYFDLWNFRYATRLESSRFQKLVGDIRALGYTGKLVYYYQAQIDKGFPEWGTVDAGFRALWDVNGVAIYTTVAKSTPTSTEVLADSQPRARMRTSIANALNGLSGMKQPIIIMMRVPSIFGGIVHDEFIEPCVACNSLAPQRTRDYQQQADAHQAVAEVINATPTGNGRVMGILSSQYWYYDDFYSNGINSFDKTNSVRGKPAEAVLAWWFKRW